MWERFVKKIEYVQAADHETIRTKLLAYVQEALDKIISHTTHDVSEGLTSQEELDRVLSLQVQQHSTTYEAATSLLEASDGEILIFAAYNIQPLNPDLDYFIEVDLQYKQIFAHDLKAPCEDFDPRNYCFKVYSRT